MVTRRWLIGLLLALTCSVSAADKAASKPDSAQDLRYGVALFHFFQQSYFNALTELMVGETVNDLPNHGESAELLRGGISLSYGLDNEAERIFNELLATHRSGEQRDVAWFYLAKLKYLRGDNSGARSALEKIAPKFGKKSRQPLNEERKFMHANLLLREGDIAAADAAVEDLDLTSTWLPYYFFNRGVLQTQSGNWQQGVASFDLLQALKLRSEEGKSLRDRALTASGFAYLAGADFARAQSEFQQVRLSSPIVDQALLGYGWAAAQQEDYQLALSPWQALRQRSLMDASVQESLLAVPYAYEKLGAQGNALREYQQSVGLLESELANVAQAIEVFDKAPVAELFEFSQALGDDWLTADDTLPINAQAPYLAHLITRQVFQNNLKELRELYHVSDFLTQGNQRLELVKIVLDERQQTWQRKAEGSQSDELQQRYDQLTDNQRLVEEQIAAATEAEDGLALMNAEELELLGYAQRGLDTASSLQTADEDVNGEIAKLELFKGMLQWQAAEQYVPRIWQLQKQQAENKKLLEETVPALRRLQQIVVDPKQFGFGGRVAGIEVRLAQQQERVDAEIALAEQLLRDDVIAELKRQEKRLYSYLGQAKLAIARLLDVGSTGLASVAADVEGATQ